MTDRPDASAYFVISRPEQRRAVTSPLRLEILEQFEVLGAAGGAGAALKPGAKAALKGLSIADIAARMGRHPASLYYHARLLEKVGLLVRAGTRKSGKRDEALYRLVASTIAMPCDRRSPASIASTVDTAAALFRLAQREMQAALEEGEIYPTGPQRTFFARRLPSRLRPAALKQVNRHIDAIEKLVTREMKSDAARQVRRHGNAGARNGEDERGDRSGGGQPISITIALLPMARRIHD